MLLIAQKAKGTFVAGIFSGRRHCSSSHLAGLFLFGSAHFSSSLGIIQMLSKLMLAFRPGHFLERFIVREAREIFARTKFHLQEAVP
jgi:hypothetical protein